MKRLFRILLFAACAVSLILFLATTWSWLHVRHEGYWFDAKPAGGRLTVGLWTWRAGMQFCAWRDPPWERARQKFRSGADPYGDHWYTEDGVQHRAFHGYPAPTMNHRWGFGFRMQQRPPHRMSAVEDWKLPDEEPPAGERLYVGGEEVDSYAGVCLLLPHWFTAGLTLVLPAWTLRRWGRLDRRARRGLCLACGYDLRESRRSGRCPECGAPVPPAAPTSPRAPWWLRPAAAAGALGLAASAVAAAERTTRPQPFPLDQFPMWSPEYPLRPEWKAAEGSGEGRMKQTTAYGHPLSRQWYQGIWQRGAEQFVVVIRFDGFLGQPGREYQVFVFDRSLRLVRRGNLGFDLPPYGIYELKSPSKALPGPYRDRWSLAVGRVLPGSKLDPGKRLTVTTEGTLGSDYEAADDELEDGEAEEYDPDSQYVFVEPVEWNDVAEKFSYVHRQCESYSRTEGLDPKRLQIRPAEPQVPD